MNTIKNIIIASIPLTFIANVVMLWLMWNNQGVITNEVITTSIDTIYIKQEAKQIQFDVSKQEIVYVPIEKTKEVITKPVNNYYYDSTVIVNNYTKDSIQAIKTTDTISNKDGRFIVSAIAPSTLFDLRLDYQLNQLQVTKTVTPKHSLFIGASTRFDNLSINADLLYLHNSKNAFRYSYDVVNNIHSIGYLRKVY
jgi:hypothetical protein